MGHIHKIIIIDCRGYVIITIIDARCSKTSQRTRDKFYVTMARYPNRAQFPEMVVQFHLYTAKYVSHNFVMFFPEILICEISR